MTLIVCLDDRNGMAFNNRRQSRDRVIRAHVAEWCESNCLWMSPYSASLFEMHWKNIKIDEDYLLKAQKGDCVFCEREDVTPLLGLVKRVIVFRWNRHYPSDLKFPMETLLTTHKLKQTRTFRGVSHPQITEEVYTRCH